MAVGRCGAGFRLYGAVRVLGYVGAGRVEISFFLNDVGWSEYECGAGLCRLKGIFRETLVWAFEFQVSRTYYPRREISVIWIEEGDLKLSELWTFLSVIWIVDFSIGYLDRREISVIWIVDFSIVPLSVVPGKPAKDPFFLEPPKPNFSEAMASCPKEDIPNFKELLQEENFYLTTECSIKDIFFSQGYASRGYIAVAIDSRYHGERATSITTYRDVSILLYAYVYIQLAYTEKNFPLWPLMQQWAVQNFDVVLNHVMDLVN
ncbi:hypothetical protein BC332_24072 [Capsicum chinense]|nr:hypothetical protein BC332_24072 [Capsicum chinense]